MPRRTTTVTVPTVVDSGVAGPASTGDRRDGPGWFPWLCAVVLAAVGGSCCWIAERGKGRTR